MRIFILQILFCFILIRVNGQHKIDIPEFKNINTDDKYPSNSYLAFHVNSFDILISLKGYSAWGPDNSVKILGHHTSGWYKIEINTDEKIFDPYTVCFSTYKINDSIGKIIWDSLIQNHLFEMSDGRTVSFRCAEKKDTILTKEGKILEVIEPFDLGCDMPEYEFEIITKNNYKKLYFYSPQEFLRKCPSFPELKCFVTSIAIFEEYLGN